MRRTYYGILMPGEEEPTCLLGHDMSVGLAVRDAREAVARVGQDPAQIRVVVVDVEILSMREQ